MPAPRPTEALSLRARAALARCGARAIGRGATDYPAALLDLPDPPETVFVRGAAPPPRARLVALVGARAATASGRSQAFRLAADLAALGFAVVSGLARGIDAAAHRGALSRGATFAVVPGELDRVTPSHHRDLAEEIVASGGLLTERPFPIGFAQAFLRRNRLIAALAAATVVVEAAERSGALSTAEWARKLGRTVLAVPGDVDRPGSRGCHALLRAGARLCEDAGDVVRAIGAPPAAASAAAPSGEAAPRARLLAVLRAGPRGLEAAAREAGLEAEAALGALLELEWSGMVESLPGQRWVARA